MGYHNDNRWKYFLGKAEIDLLWTMQQRCDQCVIYLITDEDVDNRRCPNHLKEDGETCDCFNCLCNWLNERS